MTPSTIANDVLQHLSTEFAQVREGDLVLLGSLIDMVDSTPEAAASPEIKDIRDRMAQLTVLSGDDFNSLHDFLKNSLASRQGGLAETSTAAAELEPAAVPEDSQFSDMDVDLYVEFVDEALSHLQSIELNILSLETDAGNTATINSIFRPFHTIKGVSGFLGLTEINMLCHDVENLLDDARKGKLEITGPISDLVLQTVDLLKEMIPLCKDPAGMPGAMASYKERVAEFQERIAKAKDETDAPQPTAAAVPGKPLGEIMVGNAAITPNNLEEAIFTQEEKGGTLGEILIAEHEVKPIEVAHALREQKAAKEDVTAALETPSATASENIRVRTSLLDQLMNLAGELVL
ncbi:MAG: Hpt domain-containing protein, partial [SAR324 cluster bacterium]|nr:Hpt domain-containing protein [SAR324 cluster bacterium]